MEKNKQKMINITAGGCRLCIFQAGKSVRLRTTDETQGRLASMKWIHTHFTYEVFFVVSGSLQLMTELDITKYEQGILVIPPKLKHCSFSGEGESFCLLFSFDEETELSAAMKQRLDSEVLSLPMTQTVAFYIRQLARCTDEASAEENQAAGHLAALIFGELLMAVKQKKPNVQKHSQRQSRHMGAIEEYINQNLQTKLTLADVSTAVYLSTRQVSRILEREYGCSFSQLLTDKRLARAEVLLRNTNMTVSQIAQQVFGNTPNYFYAVFKRKYGISPLQYRKEQRGLLYGQ